MTLVELLDYCRMFNLDFDIAYDKKNDCFWISVSKEHDGETLRGGFNIDSRALRNMIYPETYLTSNVFKLFCDMYDDIHRGILESKKSKQGVN